LDAVFSRGELCITTTSKWCLVSVVQVERIL
jgi:hypothetical protein